MTTMINVILPESGAWALVSSGPIANILLAGTPSGWAVFVGGEPTPADEGMVVQSLDGAWSSSVLDAGDAVYARVRGAMIGAAIEINGMKN